MEVERYYVQHDTDDKYKPGRVKSDDKFFIGRPTANTLVGQEYEVTTIEEGDRQQVDHRQVRTEHRQENQQ